MQQQRFQVMWCQSGPVASEDRRTSSSPCRSIICPNATINILITDSVLKRSERTINDSACLDHIKGKCIFMQLHVQLNKHLHSLQMLNHFAFIQNEEKNNYHRKKKNIKTLNTLKIQPGSIMQEIIYFNGSMNYVNKNSIRSFLISYQIFSAYLGMIHQLSKALVERFLMMQINVIS